MKLSRFIETQWVHNADSHVLLLHVRPLRPLKICIFLGWISREYMGLGIGIGSLVVLLDLEECSIGFITI